MECNELLEEIEHYKQIVDTLKEAAQESGARARKAEEELRDIQAHLSKTQRLAHIGSWSWDFKKSKATVSDELYQIIGAQKGHQTFNFEYFAGYLHPGDRQNVLGTIRTALAKKGPFFFEMRVIRPGGEERYLSCDGDVEYDGAGQLTCIYGTTQDVTERRLAESAVRESEERLRLCTATARFGTFDWDMAKDTHYWSPETYEIYGIPPGTPLTFEYIRSFSPPEDIDCPSLKAAMDPAGSGGEYSLEFPITRASDGVVRLVHQTARVYFAGEGPERKAVRVLGAIHDITDRKLADEQLKVSLREKEALLKEVHHRVKNNLQIINSLLNLQSGEIHDERYKNMFLDSQNRIKSMALVHELLYKSKDLSSINISEYLHSLTANLLLSYRCYSCNIALHTCIDDLYVDVDNAVPIGIIVTELISNAYKYAFPDGRKGDIIVDLHREGGKLQLVISDNGIGLPADFDIYNTTTLGLQLVELLTRQLDGNIELDREDQTIFKISFGDAKKMS